MMEEHDSGFTLAKSLKQDPALKHIPVLMLTAVADRTGFEFSQDKDGYWMKTDAFIDKPCPPKDLMTKIKKMLSKIKQLAQDVFKELGSGYSEEIYEKAMEVALRLEKIHYENQRILPIFYKNFNIGQSKPDLIIKNNKGKEQIVIEEYTPEICRYFGIDL